LAERFAFRAEPRRAFAVEREHRRRLGQAVTGEHPPPEPLELPLEVLAELRAARADQIERAAEPCVHRWEEQLAEAEPGRTANGDARAEQRSEQRRLPPWTAFQRGLDAVPERRAEPRNREQRGCLRLL